MSLAAASDESMSNEQLEALGEEIATFAARVDVATHALITRLRTFDQHEGWARADYPTCAHWLSWRTGIGLNAAREKVRVARALGELPRVDKLFKKGKLSYSKVRAITRVATPESEKDFVGIAMNATASQVERLSQAYRRTHDDGNDAKPRPRRYVRRSDSFGGMVRIDMQLPPEEAALVWEALMSAMETDTPKPEPTGDSAKTAEEPDDVTAEVSGDGGSSEGGKKEAAEAKRAHQHDGCCAGAPVMPANDGGDQEEARADAMVNVARAYLRMHPQTLGSGYELVVITTQARLDEGPNGVGAVMRNGTPLPLEMARMLACDSARVNVTADETGAVLDVGRRTRTIPPSIARALWLRDGCCRVPGCGRRRHLQGHHIEHWADGGPTSLANLVLVCGHHHKCLHEGRLFVEIRDGKLVFRDAHGRERPAAPASAATGDDLEALDRFLEDAGIHLDPSLNEPNWDGTRLNVGEALAWIAVAEQTRGSPAT